MNEAILELIKHSETPISAMMFDQILHWKPMPRCYVPSLDSELPFWQKCGPIYRRQLPNCEPEFFLWTGLVDQYVPELIQFAPDGCITLPCDQNPAFALYMAGINTNMLLDSRRIFV